MCVCVCVCVRVADDCCGDPKNEVALYGFTLLLCICKLAPYFCAGNASIFSCSHSMDLLMILAPPPSSLHCCLQALLFLLGALLNFGHLL